MSIWQSLLRALVDPIRPATIPAAQAENAWLCLVNSVAMLEAADTYRFVSDNVGNLSPRMLSMLDERKDSYLRSAEFWSKRADLVAGIQDDGG